MPPDFLAQNPLGDCVNRREQIGIFRRETSLKRRRAYPQITQIFADYGTERNRTFLISENLCKCVKSVDEEHAQAAGKRTTFFLLRLMMLFGGTKVTSTYFLAQATRVPAATQVELVFNAPTQTFGTNASTTSVISVPSVVNLISETNPSHPDQ